MSHWHYHRKRNPREPWDRFKRLWDGVTNPHRKAKREFVKARFWPRDIPEPLSTMANGDLRQMLATWQPGDPVSKELLVWLTGS